MKEKGLTSKTILVVRYAETDQMGIVHHSVYPVWFECGRTDWIKKVGMTYGEMEKEGLMLPLLKLECQYKIPAKYDDYVTVITSIKKSSLTRITFLYKVYKNDEERIIAQGETEHAWVNKEMRPVNFKKYFPELFETLKDCFEIEDL